MIVEPDQSQLVFRHSKGYVCLLNLVARTVRTVSPVASRKEQSESKDGHLEGVLITVVLRSKIYSFLQISRYDPPVLLFRELHSIIQSFDALFILQSTPSVYMVA